MSSHSQAPAVETTFLKIVNDDSVKRTYVVFSSVDIEPGKFMFWRVMATIAGSKIFLNEEKNGWYVHGIPTLGNSVPDAAASLLELIKSTNPEEVIFLGPSMGGYAAMLYGAILKPELPGVNVRSLSFGGEFLLYERETRSKALSRKEQNPDYADLRPLLDSSQLSVTHVFGDTDITDIYQSTLVAGIQSVQRIAVKNGPHAVSTFIGQNYNLIELIRSFGEVGTILEIPCSHDFESFGFGENLFNGHLALLDGRNDEALNNLQLASSLCPENAIARHKYGLALFQDGKLDEALIEQNAAVQLRPELDHAHYHLGIILSKLGKPFEAIEAYNKCVKINPRHLASRFALVNEAFSRKAYKDVSEHLEGILNVDKKNSRANDLLELIKTKAPHLTIASPETNVTQSNLDLGKDDMLSTMLGGHDFIRNDLTSSLIKSRTALVQNSLPTLEECESAIQNETQAGSWINVAAIGRHMVARWPMKLRGYLAQFDGLFNLGLRRDASEIIELAQKIIGRAPLMSHRQMRAFNYSRQWDMTLLSFSSTPHASTDERCLREAFLAAINMKDFDIANEIVNFSAFSERTHRDLSNELTRYSDQGITALENWNNYYIHHPDTAFSEAAARKDHRAIEAGYWKMYKDGCRDISFFDLACQPLPYESGYDSRVFFFRHMAYAAHPSNINYVKLLAKCFFHWRLVDEAHLLLDNHSRDGADDAEYLALKCRGHDVVKGTSVSPLRSGKWDQIALQPFGVFDAIRQANLATWHGNTHLELSAKSAIARYCSGDATTEIMGLATPPTHRILNRKLKVAVCISGQLRAFEKNAAHIVESIVKPLQADVFLHTWDKQPSTPPELRILQRFIGPQLLEALPLHLRQIAAFRQRFPKTTQKLQHPTFTDVTESGIRSILDCKKIVIESDADFLERTEISQSLLHQGKTNQAKMFYKIHACDNLRRATELETGEDYDVVIRIRPDLRIRFPEISKFALECASNPNVIYVNSTHGDGISDLFAISSGPGMTAYSAVWPFLLKYQRFDYLPDFLNQPAETLLGQHLMITGIETRLLPVEEITLLSDIPAERIDITEELTSDSKDAGDPAEVESFIAAYKSWRTQHSLHKL